MFTLIFDSRNESDYEFYCWCVNKLELYRIMYDSYVFNHCSYKEYVLTVLL